MDYIDQLLEIVKRKNTVDSNGNWSNGSSTYLAEIEKELVEVKEELPLNRRCFLEDELGDVLWDYLNILVNLEGEGKIELTNVLARASKKYEERVSGTEEGIRWVDTKSKQKAELEAEHDLAMQKDKVVL